ncbi:MAG: preprotein translocase subunit SecA [Flavobacteriales bacterium]|nr:preprotein translocase subunit SecA [Flavobacteriales bacterium]
MIGSIVKSISNLFGNKSQRDVKDLWPQVEKINEIFNGYSSLTNDELRAKTIEFKKIISERLKDIDDQIRALQHELEHLMSEEVARRQEVYDKIDELEKERNTQLEEVLQDLLPEAFALVKETSRRLSENPELEVTANNYDRDMAIDNDFVEIRGDKAIYKNSWMAAGVQVNWNMVHYDVQLIGGMVLHAGKIAEMATGEGKTLVSTLPAYLNALGGRGVHIVTVNDYLARRDCEWNGPLFKFHGLTVDCIDYHQPNSIERRNAYLADITYGTNNEFGFDYLRDNMCHDPEELVQRKHHFAMVDEVDSVLIDDARTPLIISGPVPKGDQQEFLELKPRIEKLVNAQKKYINGALAEAKTLMAAGDEKGAGLALLRCYRGLPKNKALIKYLGEPGIKTVMTKSESYHLADQQREMPKADAPLYFTIDEKNNSIELTDQGIDMISSDGEDKKFFILPDVGTEIAEIEKLELDENEKSRRKEELMREFSIKSERIHSINQLLKAYTLFEKDIEYIVQDGKIKIVDEQTGRVLDGRRYSDGLHQAIEAKENVKVENATQTFATITLQNFFRMYHKLAGMTGTAETEAGELWEIYKLDVVVIPPNKTIIRDDREDLVYKTKREKYNAVIEEIVEMTKLGRPVLVGTTSVEISELLSKMLSMRKIKHNVLNAKQHQKEADIVAEAGQASAVTIATNMAGRGTDIKLGPGVKEAGGLAIIGTERHDSRRVDRQLRGRAGRQGDQGSSQFFVSLEDDLMRLFGSERVSKIMDRFGYKEGEVIQHSMISSTIERSQKKVEQNNFGTRKRLLEYDDVMNKQRTVIYSLRRNALHGDRLSVDLNNMLYQWCEERAFMSKEDGDYENFKMEVLRTLAFEPEITIEDFNKYKPEDLSDELFHQLNLHYHNKSLHIRQSATPVFKRMQMERDGKIDNIVVPFTDGVKSLNVVSNVNKTIDSEGRELIKNFEKFVALASIDNHWKEHLRDLDDLKQAVATAYLEQKDPLLIYKKESFNLFGEMISTLNNEILSLIYKGYIAHPDEEDLKEASGVRRKTDMSRLKTGRDDVPGGQQGVVTNSNTAERVQQNPVIAGPKVGRNDPCPCGSGLKYKKCHGKDAA